MLSRPVLSEYEKFLRRLVEMQVTASDRGRLSVAHKCFSRREVKLIPRELSVHVVDAMFSDHIDERVWWLRGRLLRCDATNIDMATQSCISQLRGLLKTPPRLEQVFTLEDVMSRPCEKRMSWIRKTCDRGAACIESVQNKLTTSASIRKIAWTSNHCILSSQMGRI